MTPTTTLCSTLVKHGFTCTATLSSPGLGQITNTGTVKGKDPIGLEVTVTDTAVVSVLEIVVLPAVVNQPTALLPAPAAARRLAAVALAAALVLLLLTPAALPLAIVVIT